MSRSYHVNFTNLKGYSKKELDEMATDPNSILQQLADKSVNKKTEKKQRKIMKQTPPKN